MTDEIGFLPEGPAPGADLRLICTGTVVETDIPNNRVRVSVNDGVTWMGALPAPYLPGKTVWVVCNPLEGGRAVLVAGLVNGGATTLSRTGVLVSVNSTTKTAVVTVGGTNYTVPYIPSSYVAGAQVWVLCNPSRWGAPELVLGVWDVPVAGGGDTVLPPVAGGGATAQVEVTIRPQWSGTWRSSRSAWDRWNTEQYGGRSDLYQGSAFTSGPLIGLATYGDQLANLGAISIDYVGAALIHNGGSAMPGPPIIQGAPHGVRPSGAPTPSGDTSTGVLTPAMREGLRVGSIKSLALVGSGYFGARGTSHPAGMSLAVKYTRRV